MEKFMLQLSPSRALGLVLLLSPLIPAGPAEAAVSFVEVAGTAGLNFTSTGNASFPEITAGLSYQLAHKAMGTGVAIGDYDGDGDLDVYLLGHLGQANRLYRNNLDLGSKTFTDVTPPVLADIGFSRVAHFVDLDQDGDLDLLLINDQDTPVGMNPPLSMTKLFRNDGNGTFVDVTADSGLNVSGFVKGGCAIADYDGDGRLDIYISNWGAFLTDPPAVFPGANQLFRNLGGMVFEDVTLSSGLGTLGRDSFTAIFADLDEDGDPDLQISIDHTSDEYFRNDGGTFVNDTASVNTTHIGNDMGATCADFDADGDLDCYATNITDPSEIKTFGTTQGNVLYENRLIPDGTFSYIDSALSAGVFDTAWGWGTEAVDVDNDGDIDIIAVTGFDEFILEFSGASHPLYQTPSYLYLNDGTGSFTLETGTDLDMTDDSRALAAFDYDRDGDLDLLITNRSQPVRLFENRSTGQGHWLGLRLSPDHLAIGATVRITIAGTTQRRDIIAGHSYLTGLPSEVHFGLGTATAVDSLEIEWADGLIENLGPVAGDQLLDVTRPLVQAVPLFSQPASVALALILLGTALTQLRRRPLSPPCNRTGFRIYHT